MPKKRGFFSPKRPPKEERPLASFQAEVSGNRYRPLSSLPEVKQHNDGVLILQGDGGGQIYVVARATQVKCSVEMLEQLLIDLDAIAWGGQRCQQPSYLLRTSSDWIYGSRRDGWRFRFPDVMGSREICQASACGSRSPSWRENSDSASGAQTKQTTLPRAGF
jgi:hypothetical protein